MKKLQDAEKELKQKQDDAEQDMMMAGMVSDAGRWQRWQEAALSLLSCCKDSAGSKQHSISSMF